MRKSVFPKDKGDLMKFTVKEDERKQKIFIIKKLESKYFDLFFLSQWSK